MISIIIPTFNESDQITATISKIHEANDNTIIEVIVVDGGSSDDTIAIANQCGVTTIQSIRKGRAAQMNIGANAAKFELLYFLHADSIPPQHFTTSILKAYANGAKSGCFRLKFDYDHWFLNANAWLTRFNIDAIRFGDQSLFVTKEVFKNADGFDEELLMMEDQEIIGRLKKLGKFAIIGDYVITSARKYRENGIFRMQVIFFRIWALYYLGYPQEKLLQLHRRLIKNHKL